MAPEARLLRHGEDAPHVRRLVVHDAGGGGVRRHGVRAGEEKPGAEPRHHVHGDAAVVGGRAVALHANREVDDRQVGIGGPGEVHVEPPEILGRRVVAVEEDPVVVALAHPAVAPEGRDADEVLERECEVRPLVRLGHGDRDHLVGVEDEARDGDRAQRDARRHRHPLRGVHFQAGEANLAAVLRAQARGLAGQIRRTVEADRVAPVELRGLRSVADHDLGGADPQALLGDGDEDLGLGALSPPEGVVAGGGPGEGDHVRLDEDRLPLAHDRLHPAQATDDLAGHGLEIAAASHGDARGGLDHGALAGRQRRLRRGRRQWRGRGRPTSATAQQP